MHMKDTHPSMDHHPTCNIHLYGVIEHGLFGFFLCFLSWRHDWLGKRVQPLFTAVNQGFLWASKVGVRASSTSACRVCSGLGVGFQQVIGFHLAWWTVERCEVCLAKNGMQS
ncbi:hypothetical protein Peur_013866 [Populus x canadensis]